MPYRAGHRSSSTASQVAIRAVARRHAADPQDHNSAELVHAADRRAGIVDGGRHRAQRNVDDLDDAEFDILLHSARRADIEGADKMHRTIRRHALRLAYPHERNAGRHELAHAALHMHADAVSRRKSDEDVDIDITDIAGPAVKDGSPALCCRRRVWFGHGERTPWIGHEF